MGQSGVLEGTSGGCIRDRESLLFRHEASWIGCMSIAWVGWSLYVGINVRGRIKTRSSVHTKRIST